MKSAAQIAYIRQLCFLGLGGQVIMPEILRALHALVPSAFNLFLWADEHHQLSNMYSENSAMYHAQSRYLKDFYNSGEVQAYKTTFSYAMRTGRGWRNTERLGPEFLASDIYHHLLKPCDIRHCVEVTIWDQGRGLGSIVLNRSHDQKPFREEEEMRLRSLMPYLAHGLRGMRDLRGEATHSGESGTLIIDNQDRIVQFCPEGKRLLMLATHNTFSAANSPFQDAAAIKRLRSSFAPGGHSKTPNLYSKAHDLHSKAPDLHSEAPDLHSEAHDLNSEAPDLHSEAQSVPVQRHRNAWGEFVFRAYPLSTRVECDGSLAIVIERHEPTPITLMRTLRKLPVTARQREVCLLLSYGYTHSMIGERMHVSKHTATDYVRKIYDKLDVRSQDQLMKKLMSN